MVKLEHLEAQQPNKTSSLKATSYNQWTWDRVKQESAKLNGDKLLIIQNRVYNVTEFANEHPGGRVISTYYGADATEVFEAFHAEETAEVLPNYYVGDLVITQPKHQRLHLSNPLISSEPTDSSFRKDVEELRVLLKAEGMFEANFLYYAWKVISNFGILAGSVWLLIGSHSIIASAALLGLFWQQSGWLAHDFLHHQVFERRSWNNAMGYLLGNVCQGFGVEWWKNKHNTHHARPNVHQVDPDIDTMPVLGWTVLDLDGDFKPGAMGKMMLYNQHYLYFVILAFARLSWCLQSILYGAFKSRNPKLESATLFLHWLFYSVLLAESYRQAGLFAGLLLYLIVSQCASGVLLALVFSLNHNGMPVLSGEEAGQMDFYQLQTVTGRNVHSGLFNSWFTGGLNSQIEHHIFPKLPRHNFSLVRDRVRALCDKWQIEYHQTGILDGTLEVLDRLADVSRHAQFRFDSVDTVDCEVDKKQD